MIISDHLARSRTGIWSPLFGHARGEPGCPAVGGLVRIVWFFGQFRSLVRPEGRAWLMLRLGPLDSGVWLFPGICYLYKARLRRKPSWLPVALIEYEVNEVNEVRLGFLISRLYEKCATNHPKFLSTWKYDRNLNKNGNQYGMWIWKLTN